MQMPIQYREEGAAVGAWVLLECQARTSRRRVQSEEAGRTTVKSVGRLI